MAEAEQVLGHRIAVDRDREHVVAGVEDGLRAVAVVVVDIEHGHAPGAAIAQGLRGERGVVQEAIAAEELGAGMVAGRA